MVKIKFLLLTLILASAAVFAEERKAVFDLTAEDPERIEQRIIDSIKGMHDHYRSQGIEFKAVVVISGKSYKYFVEDLQNSPYKGDTGLAELQKKFQPAFAELHDRYGVQFDMCGVGMKARGVEASSVYPFVNTDKSKYIYLIDWQNAGYAYIPI